MGHHQPFKTNGKLNITATNHVLNFEFHEPCLHLPWGGGVKEIQRRPKQGTHTGNPNFWMILAYFLAASRDRSSLRRHTHTVKVTNVTIKCFLGYLLAPVQTIFPELKTRAVVLGSRILMMTAAKRCTCTHIHTPGYSCHNERFPHTNRPLGYILHFVPLGQSL